MIPRAQIGLPPGDSAVALRETSGMPEGGPNRLRSLAKASQASIAPLSLLPQRILDPDTRKHLARIQILREHAVDTRLALVGYPPEVMRDLRTFFAQQIAHPLSAARILSRT